MNSEIVTDILGYEFKDPAILAEALRHASVAHSRKNSNERMEFLGDSILSFVVCEHLFKEYPDFLEGDLTKIKSAVVSRKVCAIVSREIGLVDLIILGKGMSRGSDVPESVTSAVYESVIAGIYLDGGIDPARAFIARTLFKHILELNKPGSNQDNYKSTLQTVAQRQFTSNPQYTLLSEAGPDHAKTFEVCVIIAGQRFPAAWSNTKKQAEQSAALHALLELGYATRNPDGAIFMSDTPSAKPHACPESNGTA
jgi:ribonuclease III